MNRLAFLSKIDDLYDSNCKKCQYNNQKNIRYCLSECEVGKELQSLGRELETIKGEKKPMTQKTVLDQDSYKMFKAQGKSDKDIALEYGISQPTISYYKKKWMDEAIEPIVAEVVKEEKAIEKAQEPIVKLKEHSETKPTATDKTAEYESLIAELRTQLQESNENNFRKSGLIHELEQKIEKYEHISAACEDVENEIASLREDKEKLQTEYHKVVRRLHHSDYTVENQKKVIEDTNKKMERFETENKAMRNLLALWI